MNVVFGVSTILVPVICGRCGDELLPGGKGGAVLELVEAVGIMAAPLARVGVCVDCANLISDVAHQ